MKLLIKLEPGTIKKRKSLIQNLGPGLISGASDDDPSGIATYSQAGAKFGYGMLWTMPFTYPLLVCIQEVSARIGRVTGQGISENINRHYGKWPAFLIVTLLLISNTINLGADIGAMGEAVKLLIGGPAFLYALLLSLGSVLLQIFIPYTRYVFILKWLTLSLFAYVATVFVVKISWVDVFHHTLLPSISLNHDFLAMLIAVFGTTISPYLFFWQASEEAEEEKDTPGELPLNEAPDQAPEAFHRIELDTYIGMAFSHLVAFSIILATAATLHANGITNIETAAQAAEALRPLAGRFAFLLFTLGIIGTGLLALPVLAGSSAYAVGEALKWPIGLEQKPEHAKRFYGVLAFGFLVGLALNLTSVSPIKALFWAAVINGLVSVPVLVIMMLMATSHQVMGKFTLSIHLKVIGWIATAVMSAAAVGLFVTWK